MKVAFFVMFIFLSNLFSISYAGGKAMEIKSSAFAHNEMIPKLYTCDDKDISPPLMWSNAPEGTKSFALICDDPDASMGTWVHWVVYNIKPTTKELPAKVLPQETMPNSAKQGVNDFKKIGYGGPCPPGGTHRYFFKIYALDTELNIESRPTKKLLEEAMKVHILAEAQLVGKYKR